MVYPTGATDVVELELRRRMERIEMLMDANVVSLNGSLHDEVGLTVRECADNLRASSDIGKLVMLLTTPGGFIEVVARIVDTLRHHYDRVEFVIPDYAYSAGTVLALSGDRIHMDYFSRLGPIDPQVILASGAVVPALGYLDRYEELLERARSEEVSWVEAMILREFDQGELYKFDQARKLSVRLLKEWLVKYKFRDWTVTAGRGIKVDDAMRASRAEEIALELSDSGRWNSHGYGISMDILNNDLKLKIDDYGADPELARAIRDYDGLLQSHLSSLGLDRAVHSAGGFASTKSSRG